jgi:hypothetical protein
MHFLQRSTHFSKTCCRLRNFLPRSSLFMVGKAQKSHGERSELNSVFGWEKVDRWNTIRTSAIQSKSRPIGFLDFSNHEKGAPRQEISKWSTVCSTFPRSGWSVVRSVSLAKGGASKRRPSPHLHKVSTRINKVSSQTFQTVLVSMINAAESYTKRNRKLNGCMQIINRTSRCCKNFNRVRRKVQEMYRFKKWSFELYEGVSKSFRTESIKK